MVEKTAKGDWFNWRLPLYAAIGTLAVLFPLVIWQYDTLYAFAILPIASVILLILLLSAAIRKRPRYCLSLLSMLVISWIVSTALVKTSFAVRNKARWSVSSSTYKSEVLAQRDSATGELKHIEWDGWGGAGAGDTTVYLVFDPTDSLAAAAKSRQSGKFNRIPCEVPVVSRLESRWYAVVFYTDERWGEPKRDCGGAPQS
jgi:hypothetical protein